MYIGTLLYFALLQHGCKMSQIFLEKLSNYVENKWFLNLLDISKFVLN